MVEINKILIMVERKMLMVEINKMVIVMQKTHVNGRNQQDNDNGGEETMSKQLKSIRW